MSPSTDWHIANSFSYLSNNTESLRVVILVLVEIYICYAYMSAKSVYNTKCLLGSEVICCQFSIINAQVDTSIISGSILYL